MISFTCNICGTPNTMEEVPWEPSTCSGCLSNVRMRALVYLLSAELFGAARPLPEFQEYGNVKGLGLSDEWLYAQPLSEKFDFTNTFYDREPFLDITERHPEQYGTFDFILSSDVFEHVAPPVERSFEEAFRLLKPNGFLCMTVPSSAAAEDTVEHYPDLRHYSIVELGGEHVLINRRQDKTFEIHQNLEFHGGLGATLVMREFSQRDLACKLRGAGFSEVVYQTESVPEFGIILVGDWSLPLVVRKQPFARLDPADSVPVRLTEPALVPAPPPPSIAKLESQISQLKDEKAALESRVVALESKLNIAADSQWLKLGQRFGFGPKLP